MTPSSYFLDHNQDRKLSRLFRNQKLAFLIIGGLNTIIGFSLFVLFQLWIGKQFGYISALLLSHLSSVLIAYFLQRYVVFRVRGHWLRDLAKFELVQLTSIGLNFVCLPFLVEICNLTPILAQAVFSIANFIVTWFGHKYFSFYRRKSN